MTLELPALREHKEDIPRLVDAFLRQFGSRHNRQVKINRAALDLLGAYDWPGNVRELRNAIERSVVLCRGDEIAANDLPEEIREGQRPDDDNGRGRAIAHFWARAIFAKRSASSKSST